MSEHASSESHVKLYWMIGAALFALTVATVLVSKVHLAAPWGLIVGLAIAVLKASLVAAIFMHLKWESRLIHYVLGGTAFFLVVLFLLPILDSSWISGYVVAPAQAAQAAPAHH